MMELEAEPLCGVGDAGEMAVRCIVVPDIVYNKEDLLFRALPVFVRQKLKILKLLSELNSITIMVW